MGAGVGGWGWGWGWETEGESNFFVNMTRVIVSKISNAERQAIEAINHSSAN